MIKTIANLEPFEHAKGSEGKTGRTTVGCVWQHDDGKLSVRINTCWPYDRVLSWRDDPYSHAYENHYVDSLEEAAKYGKVIKLEDIA